MVNDPNDPLSASHDEFKDLRLRLRELPARSAPAWLMQSLKKQFIGPSWSDRLSAALRGGPIWRPVGAFVLVGLLAGVWITHSGSSEQDLVDVAPLVAAHARYQSESLVPPGDLAGSGFGFQLASYYGEED
jgi:hypothetical protein